MVLLQLNYLYADAKVLLLLTELPVAHGAEYGFHTLYSERFN